MSVTPFQQRVYDALKLIPAGKVTTYKELSRYLECGSAQAIGQALKKNPFAPEVPCHRVIKSDLNIGGYSGETTGENIVKKLSLLESESVFFSEGNLFDQSQLFTFS